MDWRSTKFDWNRARAFPVTAEEGSLSALPSMRRVVTALMYAIPGLSSIVALLGLVFYVFSVMATNLFGDSFAEWFGSVGASAYSPFQVMTLESWSMGIVRPVMGIYPYAWLFFLPFILLTSFTVLNLFIGIIVDAMQSQHEEERASERAAEEAQAEQGQIDRVAPTELDGKRQLASDGRPG